MVGAWPGNVHCYISLSFCVDCHWGKAAGQGARLQTGCGHWATGWGGLCSTLHSCPFFLGVLPGKEGG